MNSICQDALKEQRDENKRENLALKKDLIIAAKKKLWLFPILDSFLAGLRNMSLQEQVEESKAGQDLT